MTARSGAATFAAAVAAIAFSAALAVPAAARETAAAKAERTLAKFERTGEMTDCLLGSQINEIDPLTDELFLVRVGAGTYYLNEVNGSCNGAARSFSRLQYTRSTSQLCRLQIVSVYENTSNIFMGSCSLGSFEKLKMKPPAPEAAQ